MQMGNEDGRPVSVQVNPAQAAPAAPQFVPVGNFSGGNNTNLIIGVGVVAAIFLLLNKR